MHLNAEEQSMLSGEHGDLVREAMRFLVTLGQAYDADRMLDISYANVLIASSFWGKGVFTLDLIREAVDSGIRTRVPTTFNNWGTGGFGTDESIWERMDVPDRVRAQVIQEKEIARGLGIVPTETCAPYLLCGVGSVPSGAHISSVESSAIVYFNSVLGARTNRDCIAPFFAAITGKYPEFGYHLDENRLGVYRVDVRTPIRDTLSYGLLGLYTGKLVGGEVPVFTGITEPTTEDLMELSAALASSGSVTMFHIVGVTPEAPDLETAFGAHRPRETIEVTWDDLESVRNSVSDAEGRVDFVCLGCPHYSIYEVKRAAELLDGRCVHPEITLWICTAPQTAMFAELAGYAETIREAGGTIMTGPGFCPLFGPGRPGPEYSFAHPEYSIGSFATDAAKQAYYARPNLRARHVFLGSAERCIEAAVVGEWR